MRPSDSLADMLTRIRNAVRAKQRYVDIPKSNVKLDIVKILKNQGFIQNFLAKDDDKQGVIRVFLRYTGVRQCVIQDLQRVSRPSCRKYVGYKKIPPVLSGMGIAIMSTSQGVMTGNKAKEKKLGGELLCKVW